MVKIYLDLKRLEKWNKNNGMNFALDKNGFLQFRGGNSTFVLNHETIEPGEVMRDLRVYVRNDLTWSTQIEKKMSKAVRLLHYVKRNTSPLTLTHPKLCFYKSLILPIISYASRAFTSQRLRKANLKHSKNVY